MIAPLRSREDVLSEFNVSRETTQRLDAIVETLDFWRQRVNLIGPREWPVIWTRHIADSLQLLPFIGSARSIVDLGSGAGFPGLVIAAERHQAAEVTLVESVGKKCGFLRAASRAAGLSVEVKPLRIEHLEPFPADVVVARALASLPKLLEYASKWTDRGAFCVFPKGESAEDELTEARQRWIFSLDVMPSRTSPSGQILKLTEVQRRES
ncbi:MAG: 16S rRNA (guanine(527)-N(7))-methyltransferase RsmG [Pseudomonadota bacterium]